jgi:hypothetical protein
MNILFWLCWIIDLLLVLLVVAGSKFRISFGANTDVNNIAILLLVLILLSAIITRIVIKQKWISLMLAALPILMLILLYLFEKKTGSS